MSEESTAEPAGEAQPTEMTQFIKFCGYRSNNVTASSGIYQNIAKIFGEAQLASLFINGKIDLARIDGWTNVDNGKPIVEDNVLRYNTISRIASYAVKRDLLDKSSIELLEPLGLKIISAPNNAGKAAPKLAAVDKTGIFVIEEGEIQKRLRFLEALCDRSDAAGGGDRPLMDVINRQRRNDNPDSLFDRLH